MNTMRSDMSHYRAGEPFLATAAKVSFAVGVPDHDRFRDSSTALALPQPHEGESALRPFQHRLRIRSGRIPRRHDRVQPVLVVDAIPFKDAPGALALLDQIVEPRIAGVVE